MESRFLQRLMRQRVKRQPIPMERSSIFSLAINPIRNAANDENCYVLIGMSCPEKTVCFHLYC